MLKLVSDQLFLLDLNKNISLNKSLYEQMLKSKPLRLKLAALCLH